MIRSGDENGSGRRTGGRPLRPRNVMEKANDIMRYGLSDALCKFFAGLALALAFATAPSSASAADDALTIVALGDSLTAGYMLGPDEGFADQLEKASLGFE